MISLEFLERAGEPALGQREDPVLESHKGLSARFSGEGWEGRRGTQDQWSET